MNTTMSKETNVFQSKWGFHPCNYDIFLKLKKIHKEYYRAVRQLANYDRWNRKDPKNRVIRKWKRNDMGQKIGCEIVGPRTEPYINPVFAETVVSRWSGTFKVIRFSNIIDDYNKARMPKLRSNVEQLSMTNEQINELYEKIIKEEKEK